MTLAEAYELLGIDESADHKGARRAYLRGVKRHPPESDPEGFQRIREAWDLLEPRLRRRAPARSASAAPRRRSPEGSTRPLAPAPPEEPPPAPPEGPPPSPPQDPSSPRPAPPVARPPRRDPVAEVEEALAEGQAGAVVALLRAPATEGSEELSGAWLTDVALRLYEQRRPREAGRVIDLCDRWLLDHGGELRGLRPPARMRWLMLLELRTFATLLPPPLVADVVAGIRRGDPAPPALRQALGQLARREPANARRMARRLRRHAPMLAPMLAPALEPAVHEQPLQEWDVNPDLDLDLDGSGGCVGVLIPVAIAAGVVSALLARLFT